MSPRLIEAAFLRTLIRQKEDFLVVLHDLTTAVACADDLLVLDQGKLIFSGTKEACLEKNILEDVFRLQRYTFEEQNGRKIFFLPK